MGTTPIEAGYGARRKWTRGMGPDAGSAVPQNGDRYEPDGNARNGNDGLSSFLGWFSVGLGVAQLISPGSVARICGIDDDSGTRATMRACGLRELTSGVGILSGQATDAWLWGRVAGDAMDLALLGRALSNTKNDRGKTLFATAAVLGVAALDVMAAQQHSRQDNEASAMSKESEQKKNIIHTRRSITVQKPIEEVYEFWRNFENLPHAMRHLESVTVMDERRSHWVAKAPAGKSVEWDAEITEDVPNERIAWRSVGDPDVYNDGSVRFAKAPGDRGTEVFVDLNYAPPGGKIGSRIAMLFREEPGQQVQDDLRHFKQVMEVGEIVLSDATAKRGPHPAQPIGEPWNAQMAVHE